MSCLPRLESTIKCLPDPIQQSTKHHSDINHSSSRACVEAITQFKAVTLSPWTMIRTSRMSGSGISDGGRNILIPTSCSGYSLSAGSLSLLIQVKQRDPEDDVTSVAVTSAPDTVTTLLQAPQLLPLPTTSLHLDPSRSRPSLRIVLHFPHFLLYFTCSHIVVGCLPGGLG